MKQIIIYKRHIVSEEISFRYRESDLERINHLCMEYKEAHPFDLVFQTDQYYGASSEWKAFIAELKAKFFKHEFHTFSFVDSSKVTLEKWGYILSD